jgi:hypothetical protein
MHLVAFAGISASALRARVEDAEANRQSGVGREFGGEHGTYTQCKTITDNYLGG